MMTWRCPLAGRPTSILWPSRASAIYAGTYSSTFATCCRSSARLLSRRASPSCIARTTLRETAVSSTIGMNPRSTELMDTLGGAWDASVREKGKEAVSLYKLSTPQRRTITQWVVLLPDGWQWSSPEAVECFVRVLRARTRLRRPSGFPSEWRRRTGAQDCGAQRQRESSAIVLRTR